MANAFCAPAKSPDCSELASCWKVCRNWFALLWESVCARPEVDDTPEIDVVASRRPDRTFQNRLIGPSVRLVSFFFHYTGSK